jgi:hypothetical protein
MPLHFIILLLVSLSPLFAAQNVGEILWDGLPPTCNAEQAVTYLSMPVSSVFDKNKLPGECARIAAALIADGYLDAQVKNKLAYLPSGARITYVISAKNRYTIERVEIANLPNEKRDDAQILLAVDMNTWCTSEHIDQLLEKAAPFMSVHILFLEGIPLVQKNKSTAVVVIKKR